MSVRPSIVALMLILAACQQPPTDANSRVNPPDSDVGPTQAPAANPSQDTDVANAPLLTGGLQGKSVSARPACSDTFHQTGPGCDQAGIEARLKTLRKPGGPVARCYRASLSRPQVGLVRVRLTLTPDGSVKEVEITKDEFQGTPLASCLASAAKELVFPGPGDVPCVIVHTFPFVSEEKSK